MSELVILGKRADDMTKEQLIHALEYLFFKMQEDQRRHQKMIDVLTARLRWKT